MTRRFAILVCLLIASAATSVGCGSADEDAAVEAATQWLTLLDAGEVRRSWAQSAKIFRNNVSIEDYEKMIEDSRAGLGKLTSRSLRSAHARRSLPNAPRGRYVVVEFDSAFENNKAGIDVSPAVRDYLGLKSGGKLHWRFVEFGGVPRGPWSWYGSNNPFVNPEADPDVAVVRRLYRYLEQKKLEEFRRKQAQAPR